LELPFDNLPLKDGKPDPFDTRTKGSKESSKIADSPEIFLKNGSAVIDDSDPFNVGMKKRTMILGDIEKDDPKNWIEPFNRKHDLID
jgi:hypothetical protein